MGSTSHATTVFGDIFDTLVELFANPVHHLNVLFITLGENVWTMLHEHVLHASSTLLCVFVFHRVVGIAQEDSVLLAKALKTISKTFL